MLLVCLLAWYGMRHLMVGRLAGMTGDTAGAQTEVLEAMSLITGGLLVSTL
jgi:adenosylcobinamide-GDP ribazoletransferase